LESRLFAAQPLKHPVLDIGCGDGHFAAVTFPDGIEDGLDVTEAIVGEARRYGPYRLVAVADGTGLPYGDGCFQTVVSNCVIEHIPDVEAVVREVARVLASRGRFVFSVPSEYFTHMLFTVRMLRRLGLEGAASVYGRWWNKHAVHYHLEDPSFWHERLARHGLVVERQVYYMSVEATKVFELSHYYAIPSAVWHAFTGRWSLRPNKVRDSLAYRWLQPFASENWPSAGACSFFVARKT
jgi:SAM-dependent methyltransferase